MESSFNRNRNAEHLNMSVNIDCQKNENGKYDVSARVDFLKNGNTVRISEMSQEETNCLLHLLRNVYFEIDKMRLEFYKEQGYINIDLANVQLSEVNKQIENLKAAYGTFNSEVNR